MRYMSLRHSVLIVYLVALGVSAAPELFKTCAHTRSAFDSITLQDVNGQSRSLAGSVFDELQSAEECSTCKLSQTCCSMEVENSFKNYIVDHYRDKILSKLSDPLIACHNHSVFGEIKSYIESSKANLVANMLRAYGGYFQRYINIFDNFFQYLQSTIETGNTCRLAEEWNEVYYEVFLASFFSSPATSSNVNQLPNTEAFHQCFYQVFLEKNGDNIANYLRAFQFSYNRTMRYLRALRSLDRVILSTVDYLLRPECQASIMKMTHCSSCAGIVAPMCDGLCLNVMRGCLVDLSDLFQSLDNFSASLIELQTAISSRGELYYFWSQLDLFQSNLFILISDTVGASGSIEEEVLLRCDANGNRGKRDTPFSSPNPVRTTRQTTAAPFRSLNNSAYCIVGALSSLRTLPDSICQSSTTDRTQCWNGNSVGSYGRAVLEFNRQSQINNPEMVVKGRERHFEQQIANLQAATREMDILSGRYECDSDDEDENCSVPETCEYYDFVDAPYVLPPEVEMSGSGSGSGDDLEHDRPAVDPCAPVTLPPRVTVAPPTTEPSTAIVNELTTGTTIGGPGDEETTGNEIPGGDKGSASGLTSSLLLVVLVTCCVLLL